MKIVEIANMRWTVLSPSLYKLYAFDVHLVFTGQGWFLAGHDQVVPVPDRDTGAMMLAKELNRQRAGGGA